MKGQLKQLLESAIERLQVEKILPKDLTANILIEPTRDSQHGDYASNIALLLAKAAGMKPRDLAEKIVNRIPPADSLEKVCIAGPGFINFFLPTKAFSKIIPAILQYQEKFGQARVGEGQTINLEFVSANPTGPLHVGHGRGAAYGATLANLLSEMGYQLSREYYVNDAGRQMDILAASVWLRYLELFNQAFPFPSNGYKGSYIADIAKNLQVQAGDRFVRDIRDVFANVPPDATEDEAGDKEAHIDGLITNAKKLLGADYARVFQAGLDTILRDIREDLRDFGVEYDHWFSEKSLAESKVIERAIEKLRKGGYLYERDGAVWFHSVSLGDDKDRVIIRENGQTTYFASDLAYLLNKFERAYDRIVYIFGADHHGYVARLKAGAKALGFDPDKIDIRLVQFAVLYRGKEKVQMSTRSGSFVTLRELRDEIGKDAARFFYVMRKSEQHMDFDLDLAKAQSSDNPVYYIQYAHARICSVFRQLGEKQLSHDEASGIAHLDKLNNDQEKALFAMLTRYADLLVNAAKNYEPHLLANYLKDLATDLHVYYNAHPFIVDDADLRNARLCLIKAVKIVLANGLRILGLSAPEKM